MATGGHTALITNPVARSPPLLYPTDRDILRNPRPCAGDRGASGDDAGTGERA